MYWEVDKTIGQYKLDAGCFQKMELKMQFYLEVLLEIHLAKKEDLHSAFIDLEKAFYGVFKELLGMLFGKFYGRL